ncbi:MAG: 50S ribosomal protein L5 [Bdellovibrionales bacterium]
MNRLEEKYKKEIVQGLTKELGLQNAMNVPKVEKVVINICAGREATANSKVVNTIAAELEKIAGQKPVITKAKKAISNFKLREGMALGAAVTLRGERMWSFMDRLVNLALPRVRDFKGISNKGFDGRGNYNMGLKEQIVFPEIDYDKVDKLRGMNITICTSSMNDEHSRALLNSLGFPFRKN